MIHRRNPRISGTGPAQPHASSTPGRPRRRTLEWLLIIAWTLTTSLALGGAPALAGSPATPETSVSDVAATSATLHAVLDTEGSPLSYRFRYGADASYGSQTIEETAAQAPGTVNVEVHLQGLTAGTVYHFDVIATNAARETVESADQAFTTEGSGEFLLPDGRQYEMVTPPQKQGALLESTLGPESEILFTSLLTVQASAAGDAIVDGADQPIEPEPQGGGSTVSILATRGSAGGWSAAQVPSPHGEAVGPDVIFGPEYRIFSEDLSRSVLQQFGNFTPLSPDAVESTPYLHTNFLNGDVQQRCEYADLSPSSCFQPLETRADIQPGISFGEAIEGECAAYDCGAHFEAATPDLSHVVLASRERLTATPIPVPPGAKNFEVTPLYEWYGGQLQLINVLPGKTEGTGLLQLALGDKRHVISADGERVVLESIFEDGDGGGGDLYLRDVAKGETIQLNTSEVGCGACSGSGEGGKYMTASSEDSRIFFLDSSKLTADSNSGSDDLYECEVVEIADKPKCELTDLTPNAGAEAANVKMVLGASEDGAYVYFVAEGALATGARSGANNLYVRHAGATMFIAEMSSEDERLFGVGTLSEGYAGVRDRVSPNGLWLAFMSDRDLTGYDTRDAVTEKPDEEVYLYDAGANTLACASCDPTGAQPVGVPDEISGGFGVASIVPGWNSFENGAISGYDQIYQPRYLSDSGRLFFDSDDALAPQDVNGAIDVYQYEPEGMPGAEHACSSAARSGSEAFKPAHAFAVEGRSGEEAAGCVALISSGTSPEASTFLDASATGGDVFFMTTSRLAPQDFDNAPDVYDAHECTGISPCLPEQAQQPPACETEGSCRGAPAPEPSVYGAPSSATFDGTGNPTQASTSASPTQLKHKQKTKAGCGRDRTKKGRCLKRKAKRGKAKKPRRARNDRRSK
jgi:hypothetical protein